MRLIPLKTAGLNLAFQLVLLLNTKAVLHATTYLDSIGENFNNAGAGILDINSVEVTNTATDLIFTINLAGNPVNTDWGKYMIGINSVAAGDSFGNGWSRPISMPGMDYWIGAWVDNGNGAEVRKFTASWGLQSATYSANPDNLSVSKNSFSVTIKSAFAGLGVVAGIPFQFDIYTSGGGGGDSAIDALGNPAQSVAEWGSAYNSGSLVNTYTILGIPRPAITSQPQSKSVIAGTSATISVTANGASPLSYQWQFNGIPIAGRTNASLTLTNIQFPDTGGYSAVITNAYGSITSAVAILSLGSPVVYVNPAKLWQGYMNVFDLPSNGGAFQFSSGWVLMDLCARFSGATLILSPNTIANTNAYWYSPSGGPGATGNKIMDADIYVDQVDTLSGQTVTFTGNVLANTLTSAHTSVAFIRDFAPDYSSFVSTTIALTPGMFSISLATINEPNRHVQYGFETIGPCVWATDVAGKGSVIIGLPATNQAPEIVSQPASQIIQVGSNVAFSVTAAGTAPLNYQWRLDSHLIVGKTNASLFFTNVQFTNAGDYSLVVTNAFGATTSVIAQLTVYTNLTLIQTNRTPTTNEIGKSTIPTDRTHFKVYTNGIFQSGIAINPSKMTVVLTHGWNSSPSDWADYTAQIIQRRIGSNVVNLVAWDWATEAREPNFLHLTDIAYKTPGQGVALGTNLMVALGANYSQRIHFIGHSLGTLVNAAAANYIHGRGFSWTNTQMTLCDEAEIAWGIGANGFRQFITTLPVTAVRLIANSSTSKSYWGQALPDKFAWADNYITFCGLLHPEAANAILTYTAPHVFPDVDELIMQFENFHAYAHYFYEDTIKPSIFNTGGRTNATFMGFINSFEGGGFDSRPVTNTYFYQEPSGFELDLVQTNFDFAKNLLDARLAKFLSIVVSSVEESSPLSWTAIEVGQAVGQVTGIKSTARIIVNLITSIGGSQIHGPKPMGGGTPNTPAYAWIPLTVPSNVVSMSFNFMLQGNGYQDSFQVALRGTNILSLETSLIQTNITLNSGLLDVSPYAGQQVELFLGIVGGTSTNAAITVSDFQFYRILPPALQIRLSGTNVILTWPLSVAGYVLQATDKLTPTNSWTTVSNVPVIVNFEYAVTNQISGGSRYYRLSQVNTTALKLQAQVAGTNFILSWPKNAGDYSLEMTSNLTTTNAWTEVTNIPVVVNSHNTVTNSISGGNRFYRLKK